MSASDDDLASPFTVYHATYSIRALMVRLTLALHGKPRDGYPDMAVQQVQMEIMDFQPDQLTEFYLTKVNPDGRVPALTNERLLAKPLHETLDITWYLCEWYPGLLPKDHEQIIRNLVTELHRISFPNLTFGPNDRHAVDLDLKVQEFLRDEGVSDEYRKALKYKSAVLRDLHSSVHSPNAFAEHEGRARDFCTKIQALAEPNGTAANLVGGDGQQIGYIFGPEPTALDAHVLALLRRLHDVGRDDLVSSGLLVAWADKFSQSQVWHAVALNNGSTLPPGVG